MYRFDFIYRELIFLFKDCINLIHVHDWQRRFTQFLIESILDNYQEILALLEIAFLST